MDRLRLPCVLLLPAALSLGCPADPAQDGEGETDAIQTSSSGATGGSGSVTTTSGGGPGSDDNGTTEPASTTGTSEGTGDPVPTTGGADTEVTTSSSTGIGDSASTGELDSSSSSTGEPIGTTGELEEYACDGYWFAACSFCLQVECADDLAACEETGGCCCLAFCVAGGNDAELCQLECGLDAYPQAADDLLGCMTTECDAGGQCPLD